MPSREEYYWETTSLSDMTAEQWEALCDGCGRCCLLKLEDIEQDENSEERFVYTSVACKLMDCSTGYCSSYSNRLSFVPDCLVLTPETIHKQKHWMPETCAYRRLAEDRTLPDWHPLITGEATSTREAGYSIAGWCQSEDDLESDNELTQHICPPFHFADVPT